MEFINGEVIVHSPVKKAHNDISTNLVKLLDTYVTKHDLGFVGYEKIMIRLTRNDYEPDVCYFNKEQSDTFDDRTSLFPAPQLAIEIGSKKTIDRDRGIKYQDYQRHGVLEYWIIIPEDYSVEQYILDKETAAYKLLKKSDSGLLQVATIPKLSFPIECIFDKQLAQKEMLRILMDTSSI